MNKTDWKDEKGRRVYQGYEIIKAIKNEEIKEGTKLIFRSFWNGKLSQENFVIVKHKDIQYTSGATIPAWVFINGEFAIIEEQEEINIQRNRKNKRL